MNRAVNAKQNGLVDQEVFGEVGRIELQKKHPPSSPLEFNSTLECFPFFASPVGPSDFDNLDEDRQKAN